MREDDDYPVNEKLCVSDTCHGYPALRLRACWKQTSPWTAASVLEVRLQRQFLQYLHGCLDLYEVPMYVYANVHMYGGTR